MRSLADQSVQQMGGRTSVLARQRADHMELDRLLEQATASTGPAQDASLQQLWRLVFRHAYAEETVLWPAARACLADGEQLTLRVEQEHQQINELVSLIDRTAHDDPDRPGQLARLGTLLRQDVRDEEDVLLPRLQEALDAQQLRRLGRMWELVRRTAPTRPHAVVSRRPPGNLVAAVPLAVLDHGRDALDTAARRAPAPARFVAQAASRVLASVAGAVERADAVQRGERRTTRTGQRAAA